MEKIIFFLVGCSCIAQVGIGTVTPDNSSMLHIANPNNVSTPLIAEGLPNRVDLTTAVVYDTATGVMGWKTISTGGGLFISVQNISEWRGAPLDVVATGTFLDDNIDLGLTRSITVAPNTTAVISIEYSVPIGIVSATDQATTTVGAYIERDGVKVANSESSFGVRDVNDHDQASHYFPDWVSNNTGSPITVNYTIKGYLNQKSNAGEATYRFRRYDLDEALNDNWGIMQMHIRILVAD